MTAALRAPFPWFGGKSRVSHIMWERFGDPHNYVEPFAGSLAVLLSRPTPARVETVNDRDAHLANFWRSVQADPAALAEHADWPVSEPDLQARHLWLVTTGAERVKRLLTDPEFYDAKVAGWWVWGLCQWIGGGWCRGIREQGWAQRPDLHSSGTGVLALGGRKRPNLGDRGRGVSRQVPYLRVARTDITRQQMPDLHARVGRGLYQGDRDDRRGQIVAWLRDLQTRLARVRVTCGDWTRVLGPTPTFLIGTTAILLDPPYDHAERDRELYGIDEDVAEAVRTWAIEHGDDRRLRIALCGYDDGRSMPAGWSTVRWRAPGGYGNRAIGRGRVNARRETIWFSRGCLDPAIRQGEMLWPLDLDLAEE